MKRILFSFLLYPIVTIAQKPVPRYENDTLYTSSGYKIFIGQTLEFAKGTERDGKFRYIKIKNGFLSKTLANSTVIVKEIKKYSTTVLGNNYIDLTGYITLKNGSKEIIVLHIAFDRAIENSPVLPSELKVADEFINTRARNIDKELVTAKNLYEDRVINKAAYKVMKEELTKQ
jgi:hypothetical protein